MPISYSLPERAQTQSPRHRYHILSSSQLIDLKNGPNANLSTFLWILKGMMYVSFVSNKVCKICKYRYVVVMTQVLYELGQANREAVLEVMF